ncbi:glycosyltransferase [Ruegeria hyattellae]|uniref:glycosyltransferase n=1 Tax=Ruegeria hyattellae TaxID=3233337 RepID=UPI00355C0F71
MRVLDYIKTSPEMAELAEHRFESVKRGRVSLRRYDCDVIVSHLAISWQTLPALFAIRMANRVRRYVHVEHSYTEGFVHHNVPNLRRFHALLRLGFSMFDTVVAVSHAQCDWLKRARLCPERKLIVIRSCVDLTAFEILKPTRRTPKVIGAIGRLDRQKGFDTLIQGFRAIPADDVALHIYGTGDELEALQTLANGDPRIQFKGFSQDPVQIYAEVDVVVVPSRWEAYGLVAVESLCAGRSVLCADVDGLKDHREFGAMFLEDPSAHCIGLALREILSETDIKTCNGQKHIRTTAEAAFHRDWKTLLEFRNTVRNETGVMT